MILDRQLITSGHSVRLTVEETGGGWNLREELDSVTVKLRHYDDWHRVDRAMMLLELQIVQQGLTALAH